MSPSSNGSEARAPRSAIVTGGTRGIGRTIAVRLVEAGYQVLVCGRRTPDDLPEGVAFTAADVREPAEASALVSAAVSRFGRLDLVVNNAGGSPPAPAATVSPNLVTAVVRLNLLAPFFVAQAANAVMQDQPGGGLIVNIGSVSAIRPAPGTAAYAAAKGGLEVLTRALALEWAPNVRVNLVTAGVVRTEENAAHYGDEEALAAVAATVPMGRMATPDDIADAVLLLASPLAGYMTGAGLLVDGGGQLPRYADTARPSPAG
ncbi:SDR family oxidoreductase [Dactylosporangium fulvum]|uniref:SDR family oxidoreductase n=1 Tax=Dactylosporangium fulvum TaxID=53359 RepID=A0ABY5VPB5_9ACTN|nr:SDR family oxidoreductase [Dactylosporangium fulvum]UWP78614.1 SDR family oxidoreductase [Dactylosporangium fulvum]